jgi:2-oxoglutarate dehydrogenase E2 component (dihydrolipoamide succinyltransferase)
LRFATVLIKVPELAESLTEGTLKQFSKKVGDYVEQDEEVATIETDKIDVAVNATEAGTITEISVEEEATVTVGQVIGKLDTSGEPKAKEEKKPKEEKTPKDEKPKEEAKPEPSEEKPSEPVQKQASSPKQESKPQAPKEEKESTPAPPPPKKSQPAQKGDEEKKFTLWTRDERRVW